MVINDIIINSNGRLTLSWKYQSSPLPKHYQIEIYDEHEQELLYQRLIPGHEQSMNMNIPSSFRVFPSIYIVCIHIEEKKFCRNISLPSNSIQSASLILSSTNKHSHDDNEQYLYLIGGILLGAILVCTILILCCFRRLRSDVEEKVQPIQTLLYHPLNMISYPSQQTSECSLHSSTDTSHLSNDPYHIYQQIPSIHNCQIHSTRTHVRV